MNQEQAIQYGAFGIALLGGAFLFLWNVRAGTIYVISWIVLGIIVHQWYQKQQLNEWEKEILQDEK